MWILLGGGLYSSEGEVFTSPLTTLKNLSRRSGPEREVLLEINFHLNDRCMERQTSNEQTSVLLLFCESPAPSLFLSSR